MKVGWTGEKLSFGFWNLWTYKEEALSLTIPFMRLSLLFQSLVTLGDCQGEGVKAQTPMSCDIAFNHIGQPRSSLFSLVRTRVLGVYFPSFSATGKPGHYTGLSVASLFSTWKLLCLMQVDTFKKNWSNKVVLWDLDSNIWNLLYIDLSFFPIDWLFF